MSEEKGVVKAQGEKLGIVPYLALLFALLFFSGIMGEISKSGDGSLNWLGAFDYLTLCGKCGSMGTLTEEVGTLATSFRGVGGSGPKDAFLFAITLIPSVMFALGVVRVVTNLGALKAAEKLLTPVLRFVLGVPGSAALAMVSNFQSADVGASIVKNLKDEGQITEKEQLILTAYEYTAPGLIVNYFSIGAAVFGFLEIPLYIPMVIIIACKFIGGNLMRLAVGRIIKLEESAE